MTDARTNALVELNKLKEDSGALTLARQHGFITKGLEFVIGEACPLCDTEWPVDELRAHLNEELLSIEAIGKVLEGLETAFGAIEGAIKGRLADIRKMTGYANALEPTIKTDALERYVTRLEGIQTAIKDDLAKLDPAIEAAQDAWWSLPDDVRTCLEDTRQAVDAMPDTSAKDKAIKFLAVIQERYDRLIEANREAKESAQRGAIAEKVYDHYVKISNGVLEDIYDAVAKEFTELYKAINYDEGKFVGELKAEPAKLSLNVDFYGRGTFPPGAYDSERNQDGMGLWLYLSLMPHRLGSKFTFAVLDDVMMSVDTGHRREVCRLLKTKFPNMQFILTTHDRVWLQYTKTARAFPASLESNSGLRIELLLIQGIRRCYHGFISGFTTSYC